MSQNLESTNDYDVFNIRDLTLGKRNYIKIIMISINIINYLL